MNTNATNQSVLSFYALNDIDFDGLSFEQIWDDFAKDKVDGVAFRQVIPFDMSANDLAELIRNKNNLDPVLIDVIKDEYKSGADYIFVQPLVGRPVFGIDIIEIVGD